MVKLIITILWIFVSDFFVDGLLEPDTRPVKETEAPFMVYLSGKIYCGGMILSNDIILTAGHCLDRGATMTVRAGSTAYFGKGLHLQVPKIAETLLHENYELTEAGVQAFNDIGLILLEKPLVFNEYVTAIDFAAPSFDKPAMLYGWGVMSETIQARTRYLRTKNTTLIPEEQCKALMKEAIIQNVKQESEICTEKSVCNGDSGGALTQLVDGQTKLIGVVSWTTDDVYNCTRAPAVHQSVTYYSDWIKQGIATLKGNQSACNTIESIPSCLAHLVSLENTFFDETKV